MRLKLTQGKLQDILAVNHAKPVPLYIGFIIRRLRELQGLSQSDLSRQSEANLSYINTVESGLNNISIRKIRLLCNALQLSPAAMIAILHHVECSATLTDQARFR